MHIHFCSVLPLYPLTMCSAAVIFLSTLIVLSPYLTSLPQSQEKESWFFNFSPQLKMWLRLGRRALLFLFPYFRLVLKWLRVNSLIFCKNSSSIEEKNYINDKKQCLFFWKRFSYIPNSRFKILSAVIAFYATPGLQKDFIKEKMIKSCFLQ